jgi:ABC-type polysaccharide/polyol phosphate export permease
MSLGILWSVLNPLVMTGVLTFVFSVVMPSSLRNFPVAVLCGLIPYNFFVTGVLAGANSITDNAPLVKFVAAPRWTKPVAAVLSSSVHLAVQVLLLLGLALATGERATAAWLWLPVLLALAAALVCGLALGLAAANVYLRDTRYLLESFFLVLFWLVPVFYSFEVIPAAYRSLYEWNPVAALVLALRNVVLSGAAPPARLLLKLTAGAAAALVAGRLILARLEARIAERI